MTRLYEVTILEENGVMPHPADEWTVFMMSAKQLTEHGESGWNGKMRIRTVDLAITPTYVSQDLVP